MTPPSWPWPGDSREDRAKRVALSYRRLLVDITKGLCTDPAGDLCRLDERWASLGVHWPRPAPELLDPDEWMSAPDIAHLIDRTPRNIYDWARRGHIEQRTSADGRPEYSVDSVIQYARGQRARRRGSA